MRVRAFHIIPGALLLLATTSLQAQRNDTIRRMMDRYPPAQVVFPSTKGAACSGRFLLDSCFYAQWSAGEGTWQTRRGTYYHYDQDGRLLRIVTAYPDQEGWSPAYMTCYYRDDHGHITRELDLSHNQGTAGWDTLRQYLKNYSTEGYLLHVREQEYSEGTWHDSQLDAYGYNDQGQKVLHTISAAVDTGWLPQYRYLYSWEKRQLVMYLRQKYDTSTTSWINRAKQEYGYDEEGRRISEISSVWEAEEEKWIEQGLISYSYDGAGRLTLQLYQRNGTSGWEDLARYLYRYERPDTTEILFQVWQGNDSVWQDSYFLLYVWDGCGNLTGQLGRKPDGQGDWQNDYRYVYYYSPFDVHPRLQVEITDSGNVSCYGHSDGWAVARAEGGQLPYEWEWDNNPPSHDSLATGLAAWRWYHVKVTDATGRTAVDSVMLTAPEPVVTGTLYGPQCAMLNQRMCYCVKPPQGGYYFWWAAGGEIEGHPEGPHATVRWTRPGHDTLFVVRFEEHGCMGDTAMLAVRVLATGLPLKQTGRLLLWPNPARDRLHLLLPEAGPYRYRLFTPTGRNLLTGQGTAAREEIIISLPPLSPSLYFLEVSTQTSRSVLQVLIR